MNKDKIKLKDQELESVVGGTGWETEMRCRNCGNYMAWAGRFLGQVFDCPVCGKHTFSGRSERYID